MSSSATFRFHGGLAQFLARGNRDQAFTYRCARAATLKNAIEALGVPHTEVGHLKVNGEPATLQRIVREGDAVEVFPAASDTDLAQAGPVVFLADAHLGGLARFLRMLGFDTLHDNAMSDETIRRLAAGEGRVVLTRDRELLKCRDVARGYFVRALKPQAQLREVAARYRLGPRARPFTLCLKCNLPLERVARSTVAHRLPPSVLIAQGVFSHCPGCDRVYWPGSHYARMHETLQSAGLAGFPPSHGNQGETLEGGSLRPSA